jgi:pimeloyl-ACP methyl ester carboxylesterase
MATFVLVHGAWGGGQGWRATAKLLSAKGHDVHIATLTGLGEKKHLISPAITLETHVTDVTNMIAAEGLSDFVLAGHSYGGMIITEVANRLGKAIRSLVYVDAFLPRDGEALWDIADEPSRKHYIDAQRDMPGLVAPFPGSPSFLTRHPLLTLIEPVKMTGAEQAITRRTYIYATKDAPTVFTKFHERVKVDPDWKVYSLPTGHGVMVEKPEETAAILLEAAA